MREGDDGVWRGLNRFDEIGVDNKLAAVEARHRDHAHASPELIEYFTSSDRPCTPSLSAMRARCTSTVLTLRHCWTAISRFVWPSPISCRTSRSRAVKLSRRVMLALPPENSRELRPWLM